ncbi:MAG: heme ABC transporter ATP-binding protein [Acidobacteria bacterium]|nr:heme ABC transporter ATP-binding protein [Acidobacteriota bacterium]
MKPLYTLHGLSYRYGGRRAVDHVDLSFEAGRMTSVVGPNGAGKSTLMGVMAGVLEGYEGGCRFEGREIAAWNRRELAARVAFIPQTLRLEFPFTAEQVVFMGRTPHGRGLFETEADRAAVERALALTDSQQFIGRAFGELSGGEKQRVVLASALAQEPEALLLDEPTTFLDLKHQLDLYGLLRKLAGEGVAVVAVTHDLNLAAAYSDRLVAMACGQVVADGAPSEVLRADVVEKYFGARVQVIETAAGRPWAVYG